MYFIESQTQNTHITSSIQVNTRIFLQRHNVNCVFLEHTKVVNERQIVHNVHLVMHQTILLEKLCVLLAMLESTLQISLEIPSMKVQCIVRTARVDTTRLMPPVSVLFVEVVTTL